MVSLVISGLLAWLTSTPVLFVDGTKMVSGSGTR